MRWLSYGLLWILRGLVALLGNHGVAILALSLCVKALMAPLTMLARRWQDDVNHIKSLLEPKIRAVPQTCKGEQRHRQIMRIYKENNINPLYAFKSLLGAAVQIPFFFAAYHVLSEYTGLRGIPFLWIDDLSLPDRLFVLPWNLPYFGHHFNLLPFVMTTITIITSYLHRSATLSDTLHRRQTFNLYAMALTFFILFYTFPAGMVLYWTMNNFSALGETLVKRYFRK